MKFKQFDMLADKSGSFLGNLIEHIEPALTNNEIGLITNDLSSTPAIPKTGVKPCKINGFVELDIATDDNNMHYDAIKSKDQEILFKVLVSKEDRRNLAVKWRFYQYLKISRDFSVQSILMHSTDRIDDDVQFILISNDETVIFVLCFDALDDSRYDASHERIQAIVEKGMIPDRILFVTGWSYRSISLEKPIITENKSIFPELWVEWNDDEPVFDGDDLLVVNDDEMFVAGYNFTNMDEVLEYVYNRMPNGRTLLYKEQGYFSGIENPQKEMIWKGIIIKNT
ncbi:MAG TPA: hypothetical protein VKM55_24475 [Candidatus Lokiarchaeia archaeon]|nr:hypothetical protein [Candidatus Lokiarchaeia archaeon]